MISEPYSIDLDGLLDLHIHTSPDVRPRCVDDIEAAQQAADAGLAAICLKSHVTATADRATIARKIVPSLAVYGSITLNREVGGLNPIAVETALKMGARVVWMPTTSAINHISQLGGVLPGISLFKPDSGKLKPALYDILDLVKQYDAILATGHISVPEIVALVGAAQEVNQRKVVITHPEAPWIDLKAGLQLALRDKGAHFERCYASTCPQTGQVPIGRIAAEIRQVGLESTILTTDLGNSILPAPIDGMRDFYFQLLAEGFSDKEIRQMAGENPSRLVQT